MDGRYFTNSKELMPETEILSDEAIQTPEPARHVPEIFLSDGNKGTLEDLKNFPKGSVILLKIKHNKGSTAEYLDELVYVVIDRLEAGIKESYVYGKSLHNSYVFDHYSLRDLRLVSITLVAPIGSINARLLKKQAEELAKLKLRLSTIKDNFQRLGKNWGILE